MSTPLPFTVIGGFLGAGKTTLLNRLLQDAGGRRFAVLVNDFGALDIDGGLVRSHGGETVALANGCLCCTIGDSLVTTLLSLLEQPGRFDHIVVEASGVADPGRIAGLAELEPRLIRDGVIVVADANDVRERAADRRLADTVMRQLRSADLLVLNKTDLARDPVALRRWLCEVTTAPILEAQHADVPIGLLFGLDRHGATTAGMPPDRFTSWTHEWAGPVERDMVLGLLHDSADRVLRAKGILRFADCPGRRSVVHLVGRRLDVRDEGPWGDTASSRLVLLGFRPVLGCLQEERPTWQAG